MPLEAAITQSKNWMTECSSLIDGTSFTTTSRLRIAASFMHLCVEHQQGIHTLVDHGLIGSALALLRPQFEAYVRGTWYHRCATDDDIEKFLRGLEPPRISHLLSDLKVLPNFDGARLEAIKQAAWNALNDFTHGGVGQIKARITRDEITRCFKPEHIVGLLNYSATLSLLAGTGIAGVASSDALAQDLYAKYQSIYQAGA